MPKRQRPHTKGARKHMLAQIHPDPGTAIEFVRLGIYRIHREQRGVRSARAHDQETLSGSSHGKRQVQTAPGALDGN